MQWRSAGETRFATPVSRISGLPRAGILRLTAWLGISVRTGLLRSLEPAIRAGQRLVVPALLLAVTSALAGDKALSSRPNILGGQTRSNGVTSRSISAGGAQLPVEVIGRLTQFVEAG